MYSFLINSRTQLGAIKPQESYTFYVYQGKAPIPISYRGAISYVKKGERFGVRKSASGKQIRLVRPGELTKVYTLDLDTAKALARGIRK